MKKSNRQGYKGESWKQLEKIMALGRSRGDVFSDWIDLMLAANLALTDNMLRGNIKEGGKFDGVYEDRYMAIVERYSSNQEQGKRPVDYFAAAYGALLIEIDESDRDPLGDIFQHEITYGEHGQFFTPQPVADMVASVIYAPSKNEEGRQVVCDLSCGSGVMLLAAGKQRTKDMLVGVDLDIRCAKMCALNMSFRGLEADVYHGDTLSGEMYTVWMVRGGGFMKEEEKPRTPPRLEKYAKEQQGKLFAI